VRIDHGWLRMTCERRDWTSHLGSPADALVPEPRLMNDGGSLAFSAGNRDHCTLGCALQDGYHEATDFGGRVES
jgi:hypothetical protein